MATGRHSRCASLKAQPAFWTSSGTLMMPCSSRTRSPPTESWASSSNWRQRTPALPMHGWANQRAARAMKRKMLAAATAWPLASGAPRAPVPASEWDPRKYGTLFSPRRARTTRPIRLSVCRRSRAPTPASEQAPSPQGRKSSRTRTSTALASRSPTCKSSRAPTTAAERAASTRGRQSSRTRLPTTLATWPPTYKSSRAPTPPMPAWERTPSTWRS
mmetsp:Transcript_119371/g.363185  ORF Transcript_119371/g.363185 Transcript_119371/m.363185 type:complete len:217 (-) Transcript_119371:212-862(-)